MKLQNKKSEKLNLVWDKKEQVFTEKQKLQKTDKNTKRDVEEYFQFLSEIESDRVLPSKERPVDKQFVLL